MGGRGWRYNGPTAMGAQEKAPDVSPYCTPPAPDLEAYAWAMTASERCAEEMQACVGKTIAAVVHLEDSGQMGDGITLRFTDGTSVDLFGEYDEGVMARRTPGR